MTESHFIDCFYCNNNCKVDGHMDTCNNATHCWKGTFRAADGRNRQFRGCFNDVKQVQIYCDNVLQHNTSKRHIECCTKKFCNNGAFPILNPPENQTDLPTTVEDVYVFIGVAVTVFAVWAIFATICSLTSRKRFHIVNSHIYRLSELRAVAATEDNTTRERQSIDQSLPEKSGCSNVVLTKHRLSEQINLNANIGRFGPYELWRGTQQDDKSRVMVKIYSPYSETLWAYEIEIYTKLLHLKHDNVLGYVGNDRVDFENDKHLWLVTHDHLNGSLMNYLNMTNLKENGIFTAIFSLVKGLMHLHTSVTGDKGQLPMAHRNLSSKTVFVKSNGECVIGGLEHTVTQERLDQTDFLRYASKRYMSPEFLEPGFAEEGIWSLETFQKADMYSLALILWEICRMCPEDDNVTLYYMAPFSEWFADGKREPTMEEMRQVVFNEKRRPEFPNHWDRLPMMIILKSIIGECWNEHSEKRPTILRVRERIKKIKVELPLGCKFPETTRQ